MARSGNFETKIAGGSSGGYYVGVDWSINSQTSNPPKSNVTASVYVRSSGSGYTISSSVQKDVSVTINGTKYTGTNTIGIGTNTKKVLLTKTVDVPHNSDGTKSCSFAGSFYVGFTLSGTSLSTVSTSGTGYFDNITVNTPPSLGGSAWTNISGTIPENTGNITISWNAASDAQNNVKGYRVYRYVNGGHNHTLWPGGNSVTDNIGGFGEGTSVYYKIWAYDAFDAYSGEINSNTVTKNSLSGGWFTGHSADLGFSSNSVELYFTGGKNSNGSTVRYECYSDDVTVYNRTGTTGDRQTISIWRSGSYPSGPYIKFEDLKNKFKGSNYNGRLHVGLRTYNDYGTSKWSGGSIGVDLRTNITVASGSTSINSNSYYTIGSTNYLIPGRKNITLNWPAATDPLGTSITYRIEQNINGGGWSTLYNGATGTSHSFSLNVSGKPTYTFRVIARNGYGWEKELSGAPYAAMYTYSAPSISITGTTRTADKLSVSISTGISTDIPGNAIKSLRWTFGSKSGTLATSAKSFDITGLAQTDSGTFSVIIEDNHGSSVGQSAVTINGSVPQFYPVLSIRKNGVGINGVPNGRSQLYVNGMTETTGLNIDGYKIMNSGSDHANKWTKVARLRIPSQYGDAGFIVFLTGGGSGGGTSTQGRLVGRIKQQSPMGQAPATSLYLYDGQIVSADSIKLVLITNSATETVAELWYKNTVSYEYVSVSPIKTYGEVTFYNESGYVTALPSGTQTACQNRTALTSADLPSGNSGIYGKLMKINTDGVVETGKYLDFHDGDSGQDYSARITCQGSHLHVSGGMNLGSTITAPYGRFSSNPGSGDRVMIVNQNGNTSNHCPLLVETSGATNWGNTLEIRTRSSGGDRPTILFSSENTSRTYTIGMGEQSADGFTINYNHGIYGSGWGTNLLMVKPDWGMGLKQGWYRSWGNNGWYNETHQGGIFMEDSTWVKVYNNKAFYTGGRIKTTNAVECRYIDAIGGQNLDISTNGSGTIYINAHASSGAQAYMNRNWSGSAGSEFSFYNSKGNAFGFLGNSGSTWFRVYGYGGSVSYRQNKYNITKADTNEQYENVKSLNIYKYRSLSNEKDKDGNVVEEIKREDLYLGCMVDELPIEAVFYDNESGDGKAVDNYSYATMILGALQESIKKIEMLERKVEELENGIRS